MLKKGGVRVLASLRVENCRSQKHGRSDDITFVITVDTRKQYRLIISLQQLSECVFWNIGNH